MADSTGPTELVAPAPDFRNNRYVDVRKDRLHASYSGDSRDVATLTANRPVPKHMVAFYFEALCTNQGSEGKLTIGFVPETWKRGRQAGWDDNSYGYHGKDGKKYSHSLQGEEFGPAFGTGDVVGAGIILAKREIFFTKNGTMLPAPAFKNINLSVDLYPAISLQSKDEAMEVNFGQAPFVFDIQVVIQEERASLRNDIAKVAIPPDVLHGVVRNYLIYHAHVDTLAVFDRSAGSLLADGEGANARRRDANNTHAPLRKALRQHIMAFDCSKAIELITSHFPGAFTQECGNAAALHLHCLAFAELVHRGDVMAALEYGRAHLAPFQRDDSLSPEHHKLLGDTIAIIAYPDLTDCPVRYLVEPAQRSLTAGFVNAAILQLLDAQRPQAAPSQQRPSAPPSSAAEDSSRKEEAAARPSTATRASHAPEDRDDAAPMDVDGGASESSLGALTSAAEDALMRCAGRSSWEDAEEGGGGPSNTSASVRPGMPVSVLELIMKQLQTVTATLHDVNGQQGEPFDLQRELRGPHFKLP